ncbi:hypothetical protein [Rhodonellum sp.]|uniref:hypothetical protein n=1 Tax=Rhodonellum sp. TaxID=2231180 RepID=UPI002718E734|nr:hypothetical protein [Rhodonellum sp.]MDO9553264.1 hypothetical protein [Rhodonellum sp.]
MKKRTIQFLRELLCHFCLSFVHREPCLDDQDSAFYFISTVGLFPMENFLLVCWVGDFPEKRPLYQSGGNTAPYLTYGGFPGSFVLPTKTIKQIQKNLIKSPD